MSKPLSAEDIAQKHRAIDRQITDLEKAMLPDRTQIQSLKLEKLGYKDKMQRHAGAQGVT